MDDGSEGGARLSPPFTDSPEPSTVRKYVGGERAGSAGIPTPPHMVESAQAARLLVLERERIFLRARIQTLEKDVASLLVQVRSQKEAALAAARILEVAQVELIRAQQS